MHDTPGHAVPRKAQTVQFLTIQYDNGRPHRFYVNGRRTSKERHQDLYHSQLRAAQPAGLQTVTGKNRAGERIYRQFTAFSPSN